MKKNTELIEQIEKLIKWKKGRKFIASKLNITEDEVSELLGETEKDDVSYWQSGNIQAEVNLERGTRKSEVVSDFEPKNPEELTKLHKVDTSKYRISSYWTKQRGDKFTSSLLCTLIKPSDFDPKKFGEFLKGYKSAFRPSKVITGDKRKETVDVEISLADFHLDKLDIDGETITDRKEQYIYIVKSLLNKVDSCYNINKIVFTIGSDYFHTDSYNATTTKGTPLEASTTWYNAYEEGFDLMVWAISFLRSYCKGMEIILVNGNHDKTKSYYLAHALSTYFSSDKGILFDRGDSPFKHTTMGCTFVGYGHGDGKIDELPLIFATSTDSSVEFGLARYREIRTGDKHFYMTKEIKGVRIQQLPSLAGTDRWHRDHQYINNLRAALALVYHPTKGRVAEFEERI